jgi:hypothetical protein
MVILVFNMLILYQIREMTKRRISMAAGGHTTQHQRSVSASTAVTENQSVRVALKAERKKSTMIVLTGVNYVTCHIAFPFVLIINQFCPYILSTPALNCLFSVTRFLTYAAYITPFLFYYFFNTHFKRLANRNIRFAFYPFVLVYRMFTGPRLDQQGGQD